MSFRLGFPIFRGYVKLRWGRHFDVKPSKYGRKCFAKDGTRPFSFKKKMYLGFFGCFKMFLHFLGGEVLGVPRIRIHGVSFELGFLARRVTTIKTTGRDPPLKQWFHKAGSWEGHECFVFF